MVCEKQLDSQHNRNCTNPAFGGDSSHDNAKTPSSKTGLNSQPIVEESSSWNLTVKVDWFQGTMQPFPTTRLEALIRFVEKFTKDKFVVHAGKGQFKGKAWANHAVSAKGVRIWYNLVGENGDKLGHGLISFPGSALANLPAGKVRKLVRCLKTKFGMKVTRVDTAIDDYSKRITYDLVSAAIEAGHYSGFETGKSLKNFGDELGGWTICLGSPKSDRMLVIYDKNAESAIKGAKQGEINANRLELRLRDELADRAVEDWLEIREQFSAQYLAGLVVGAVDFVEKNGQKNSNRWKRLDWWQQFKDAVGFAIRHSVQRVTPNLKKAKRWINHQVACMLAAIKEVVGESDFAKWLSKEIENAPKRFNQSHHARIIQWMYEHEESLASG
jgi:DNA relaxase NicK